MTIQIVRLVKNCLSLELDCKKAGRTNKRTPIIYTTGSNWSIISIAYPNAFDSINECKYLDIF